MTTGPSYTEVKRIRKEFDKELSTLRGGDQLPRHLAQMGMRLFEALEATLAEASRLRDLRDALVDSMERQGGIPMTDALADALVAAGVDITGKRELEVICETCLIRAGCPSFKEGQTQLENPRGSP